LVDNRVDGPLIPGQHPHSAPGAPKGHVAREGLGETQPRTDRVASDRRPRRTNDHAGGGEQAPGSPGRDRQRPPPPTRVDSPPELPPAYDRALDAGLAAIPLAIGVTA